MIKIKDKSGELTTQQLVTIIILIASFIIILLLIFRLNLGKTSDQEICRNSVVVAGKLPLGGSLDCKTHYFNVTSKDKTEEMKTLADEMSSCWYEFGEGKIDYISRGITEKVSCSVCSIASFDSRLKDTSISYQEFYDYLRTTKKTETQTYLQYLYGVNDLGFFSEGFNPTGYMNNKIEFGKSYFILTGMAKEGYFSPKWLLSWKVLPSKAAPQPVVILEKTKENYDAVGCDTFLTKA